MSFNMSYYNIVRPNYKSFVYNHPLWEDLLDATIKDDAELIDYLAQKISDQWNFRLKKEIKIN